MSKDETFVTNVFAGLSPEQMEALAQRIETFAWATRSSLMSQDHKDWEANFAAQYKNDTNPDEIDALTFRLMQLQEDAGSGRETADNMKQRRALTKRLNELTRSGEEMRQAERAKYKGTYLSDTGKSFGGDDS